MGRHARLLVAGLLVAALLSPCVGRSLAQSDVPPPPFLSNSNGCLSTIPKCEEGACVNRDIKGVAQWVCLRCLGNYIPVMDDSGQDNILQCVCPKGHFESGDNATTCTRCSLNSFCPGGDQSQRPTSRGPLVPCGPNLVTRNTGARRQTDCVAPRGYALTSPTAATACAPSEYAPHFNRLGSCLKCQSGLQEAPDSNLTASMRESKRAVCKVPPGRYMSQGLVRVCPQGQFRPGYLSFEDPAAQQCLTCNPGITTEGPGAGSASLCNRVLPGYGISQVLSATGQQELSSLPGVNTTGLPAATICALGYYSAGGHCVRCPGRTVTQALGARAVEECVVPPGYFLSAGDLAKCAPGGFREGWVLFSDPKATQCSVCGGSISSEAREVDVNPLAGNGSLVSATSASCFIDAGQGMIAAGRNAFTAQDCAANTYGVSGRVYGLQAAPCKPCPRNMITDGLSKVNSSDACVNPAGFGYASEGASRCAVGFFAGKGSRRPCAGCPQGRTTLDKPLAQASLRDCFVKPGFGVANASLGGDAFNMDTSGMGPDQLVALPVLECPVGSYGPGNASAAKCAACPAGSSTEGPGASSLTSCSVCVAGFGQSPAQPSNSSNPCPMCPISLYQPGGLTACLACPNTTFYAPVDGLGDPWTSAGTTLFAGAIGSGFCVPRESQLSPEAGQAYFGSAPAVQGLLTRTPAATLAACLTSCPATNMCLAQYSAANSTCSKAVLTPAEATAPGFKLLYKLPPSDLASVLSVKNTSGGLASVKSIAGGPIIRHPPKPMCRNASSTPLLRAAAVLRPLPTVGGSASRAKTMASGIYAVGAIPNSDRDAWLLVGTNLDTDARTFAKGPQATLWRAGIKERDCRALCDNSNVCWGFIMAPDGASCLFRGGEDALKTRSFFILPQAVDAANSNSSSGGGGSGGGQQDSALEVAVSKVLAIAAGQGVAVTRAQVEAAVAAVYAQSGSYDADAALQIIVQAAQAAQAELDEAVAKLIDLGSSWSPPVANEEAAAALATQTTPYDPTAALQAVDNQRQARLSDAVAQLQRDAPLNAQMQPTWAQAAAALAYVTKGSGRYDADSNKRALELLRELQGLSPQVLELATLEGYPGFSSQEAVSALLQVWPPPQGIAAHELAFKWLAVQRVAAYEVLSVALDKGLRVSFQAALAAVGFTSSTDSNKAYIPNRDAAVEWLAKAGEIVKARVLPQAKELGGTVTWDQALTVAAGVYARTQSFDDPFVDRAVDQVQQLASAAADLIPKADAQGIVKLSPQSAVDVVLAGLIYTRVLGLTYLLDEGVREGPSRLAALAAVASKVREAAAGNVMQVTPEQAFAAVLATYARAGSLDPNPTLKQVALLPSLIQVLIKVAPAELKLSEGDAIDAWAAVFGRAGFEVALRGTDASAKLCVAYLQLALKR